MTACAVVVPILLPAGHVSALNLAALQRSAAFGSPTSPCGSTSPIDFTSSLVLLSEKAKSTVTSGWAPACVVDGVSLKFVIATEASDAAGNVRAATRATMKARGKRTRCTVTARLAPVGPAGAGGVLGGGQCAHVPRRAPGCEGGAPG